MSNILVYMVEWIESEQGWGTRLDGFTFHSSVEDREKFKKEYQAQHGHHIYSRPERQFNIMLPEDIFSIFKEKNEKGYVWEHWFPVSDWKRIADACQKRSNDSDPIEVK